MDEISEEEKNIYGMTVINYLSKCYGGERRSMYRGLRNCMIHAYDGENYQRFFHQPKIAPPQSRRCLLKNLTKHKIEFQYFPKTDQDKKWIQYNHFIILIEYLKEICYLAESEPELFPHVEQIWKQFKKDLGDIPNWWELLSNSKLIIIKKLWNQINYAKKIKKFHGYYDKLSHLFESLRNGIIHCSQYKWNLTESMYPFNYIFHDTEIIAIYLYVFGRPFIKLCNQLLSLVVKECDKFGSHYEIAKQDIFPIIINSLYDDIFSEWFDIENNCKFLIKLKEIKNMKLSKEIKEDGEQFIRSEQLYDIPIIYTDILSLIPDWRFNRIG
jgi:hypothetical protein